MLKIPDIVYKLYLHVGKVVNYIHSNKMEET